MQKLFAIVLVVALGTASPCAEALDPDPATQLIFHLRKLVEYSSQVARASDAPVEIPDEAKRDVHYEFQKRMALAGHGVLFDIDGNRVELNEQEAIKLQAEMLDAVNKEQIDERSLPQGAHEKLDDLVKELDGLAISGLDDTQAVERRHFAILAKAYRLDEARRSAYLWRENYLWNHLNRADLRSELRDINARLNEVLESTFWATDYAQLCNSGGVPVPPDFSVNGSAWTYQGNLTENLLKRGAPAQVWTWASPSLRGVCIALPRDSGGPNEAAGIICQGAATGNACFWDNIDRTTGDRIPWATNTLHIDSIQDATVLGNACPACHKGNNAFLVSPDDPTWCRLLRGGRPDAGCAPPDGVNAGNLTLLVDPLVNPWPQPESSVVHSRYTPLSGNPPRSRWTNDAVTARCSGACHLKVTGGFRHPPMPPDCGRECE